MKQGMLKVVAINLGVLVFTLLILWLMGEVALRVLYIQPMSTRAVPLHQAATVTDLVYELRPNTDVRGFGPEHITVDEQGFRTTPGGNPDGPLIALIGDSYTFGHGVNDDETNPAYLQEEFPVSNVLNAGVDGYNIEQEALVMEHKIAPLNPEIIVVEFVFNDMIPKGVMYEDGTINVGQGTQEEQDEAVREAITKQGLINFPGKFFLQKHSAVFNFLERTTKGLPFRARIVDEGDTITSDDLAFYERWFAQLDAAVQTEKKMFVIWPESNWHEASRTFLRSLAEERGYIVLDFYNTFGNGYRSLGWDYHPHPSVHKQAAELIAQAMREAGWIN